MPATSAAAAVDFFRSDRHTQPALLSAFLAQQGSDHPLLVLDYLLYTVTALC